MYEHDKAAPSAAQWATEHIRDAVVTRMPSTPRRFVEIDGRSYRVQDRNDDTTAKRERLAHPRYVSAVERWGIDALVYEYRLTFPAHLDVLDLDDNARMWAIVEALDSDAFVKFEDGRSTSLFPTNPHAHLASTRRLTVADLPEGCKLRRRARPLDLYTVQASTKECPTLWGALVYWAKPVLGGAARPTPAHFKKYGARGLEQQLAAAVLRTVAAERRASRLPDCTGWVTGGRKRARIAL